MITVTFNVAANAPAGASPLTLTNVNTSNDNADLLTITSVDGAVNILGPTAASVTVSGRVLVSPNGRGLTNAVVVMTDMNGNMRYARSSSFGYYRFEDVEVGQTYIFDVHSKRYQFAPQIVTVMEELTELNFTAEP